MGARNPICSGRTRHDLWHSPRSGGAREFAAARAHTSPHAKCRATFGAGAGTAPDHARTGATQGYRSQVGARSGASRRVAGDGRAARAVTLRLGRAGKREAARDPGSRNGSPQRRRNPPIRCRVRRLRPHHDPSPQPAARRHARQIRVGRARARAGSARAEPLAHDCRAEGSRRHGCRARTQARPTGSRHRLGRPASPLCSARKDEGFASSRGKAAIASCASRPAARWTASTSPTPRRSLCTGPPCSEALPTRGQKQTRHPGGAPR